VHSSATKRAHALVTDDPAVFRLVAEEKTAQDGWRFISLPHNNRIYEHDWGYTSNSMGKDGQRIGQYSVPLDEWCDGASERMGTGPNQ
jgi:hypothetical protein